jgi:DNA-directed RNA polymerase specialized sigma24 family protein
VHFAFYLQTTFSCPSKLTLDRTIEYIIIVEPEKVTPQLTDDHNAMSWILTGEALEKLLDCLDDNRDLAGEKYEDLRRALVAFFARRGIPFPEECADVVFDRVSRRLVEGVEIKNIYGYSYEVARLVLLERIKSRDHNRTSLDEIKLEAAANDPGDDISQNERRQACLDRCLQELPPESRALIIEYYQDNQRDKINRRKAMARRLGVTRAALANRAQRLRVKLEQCLVTCLQNDRDINLGFGH